MVILSQLLKKKNELRTYKGDKNKLWIKGKYYLNLGGLILIKKIKRLYNVVLIINIGIREINNGMKRFQIYLLKNFKLIIIIFIMSVLKEQSFKNYQD